MAVRKSVRYLRFKHQALITLLSGVLPLMKLIRRWNLSRTAISLQGLHLGW